jgi:DnaJ family protein C protein 28
MPDDMDSASKRIAEDRIEEAMQEGAFDDLPGKGKPLNLEDDPFDKGTWAAHHLLRINDYTLPWIGERRDIDTDVEAARTALARTYRWAQAGLTRQPPDPYVEAEWQRAVSVFREQATKLNRRIRDYNLKAPDTAFHRPLLDVEKEIESLSE